MALLRKSTHKTTEDRYAPAERLAAVRALLISSGGVSIYDIKDRFGVSIRTAIRYLRAIERAGEPLYEEMDGKRKIWRLMPTARREMVSLTLQQMATLSLSRRVLGFLKGTGLDEDLDDVFDGLEKTMRRQDYAAGRNLDRKLYDVNEAPYLYEGRLEDVDEIVTGLLKEESVRITYASPGSKPKTTLFDPYSLVVYRKGLYIAGLNHHHSQRRMHGLDTITNAEWVKGARFVYPDDFQPSKLVEGAFGIHREETTTRVRIFFSDQVSRYVTRRLWHPSQKIKKVQGGHELTMNLAGTAGLKSWVFEWGDQAEVLEPASLREEVAAELARAATRYGAR